MATLSVVVITRNEQDNLAGCLDSVPFADEIVVVDDGSTDGTREIARGRGARVFERKLERFGWQKQFAIDQATSDWVLVLDADERLTDQLAGEIREVVAANDGGIDGYFMRRRTWLQDRAVDFSGWYKCSHLRLFRRGHASYVDRRVHEYPELREPAKSGKLRHPIEHYTYTSESDYEAKLRRYTRLAAQDWYDAGRRVTWLTAPWFFVVVPAAAWVREFVVQKGYRGGRLGCRIANMSARADLMTARELWRLHGDGEARGAGPSARGDRR